MRFAENSQHLLISAELIASCRCGVPLEARVSRLPAPCQNIALVIVFIGRLNQIEENAKTQDREIFGSESLIVISTYKSEARIIRVR